MKKLIMCASIVALCLITSCIDKREEVDEGSVPSWLGSSIYVELENADQSKLTGNFTYYLRLIDDIGLKSVMSQTGSETVFPANDEAFERFFADNDWGVTSYDQLSEAQKKLLLNNSIIDNAILIDMLSNVSSGSTSVTRGLALKHATKSSVIDSVPYYSKPSEIFPNNSYFAAYDGKGLYAVSDATDDMMVHFTRSQMLENDITTIGSGSDFEIITGLEFPETDDPNSVAFIFRNYVINPNITCQNGYIHQVEDVMINPGNLANVLRSYSETSLFSRMLDRFAIPYYNSNVTLNYNDAQVANGEATVDSVFEIRYLSTVSQGQSSNAVDNNRQSLSASLLLPFDPGWNEYYVEHKNQTSTDWTLADIGAIFAPDDDAITKYFLPGGGGSFIIDRYGVADNTKDNLEANIDAIPQSVIQKWLSNLMKTSFTGTVPSKFSTITNDVSDEMGMTLDYIKQNSDGTYDIKIANNGVIYVMNTVIAPTEYECVSAPATFSAVMNVINWLIQNKAITGSTENVYSIDMDFYAYLRAMTANYAVFLPNDEAFDHFMVNPATLGTSTPQAVHLYYDDASTSKLMVSRWEYDPTTKTVGDSIGEYSWTDETQKSAIKSFAQEVLNYHTVVLESGETLGTNNYYKTKGGGEVLVNGTTQGATIQGGGQIDDGLADSKIVAVYEELNGTSYEIDHLIQGPEQSIYKILTTNDQFSEFVDLCEGFDDETLLDWAGISSVVDEELSTSPQDMYHIFVSTRNPHDESPTTLGLDYNVRFFRSYNFTVYAPNNDAIEAAYKKGLPSWEQIYNIYTAHGADTTAASGPYKAEAYSMIDQIRSFVRYHFQNSSVYADNVIETANYQTFCSDDMGINEELSVSGSNGRMVVTDGSGTEHIINVNGSLMVNQMARDYEFEGTSYVKTSSFAVIHELSEALDNGEWSSARYRNNIRKNYPKSIKTDL